MEENSTAVRIRQQIDTAINDLVFREQELVKALAGVRRDLVELRALLGISNDGQIVESIPIPIIPVQDLARQLAGVGPIKRHKGERRSSDKTADALLEWASTRRRPWNQGDAGRGLGYGGSSGSVTRALNELIAAGLVECTTPEKKRWRLYQLKSD